MTACQDLEDGLERCDGVVVATTTDTHVDIARLAADHGRALFIEKPISHNMEGVAELSKVIARRNLVSEVGCQLRAHPNLRYLKSLITAAKDGPLYTFRAVVGHRLDYWRPNTDYRVGYSADHARGGGALMDLVHEIDLVCWLAGKIDKVSAHLSAVSDLEIRAEDLVNLILFTHSGAVGQIQLDMVSPAYRRRLELVFRDAVYEWDYQRGVLDRSDAQGVESIHEVPASFDRNTMFLTHMQHFLSRLADSSRPAMCSYEDGVEVLRVAVAARRSSDEDRCTNVELGDP